MLKDVSRKKIFKKIWKKQFSTFILMTLIFVFFLSTGTVTFASDMQSGKMIYVVYDDSRSMYMNGETRWCKAKYAMEVFCAMLGENDTMKIFSMNSPDVLTVTGKDSDRVEMVHNMTSLYSGTPFSAVTKAGNELRGVDSSYERWLVVLTDGSFDSTPQSVVQTTLNGYNSQGIKTVYLAIGNGAVKLESNTDNGGYAEKAASTEEILSKVTDIANQIFEHQVLGSSFISEEEGKTVLDIDIPTEQIVIFAQGENASVGALELDGKTISPTYSYTVRHSGDVMPLNDESIKVDTSLKGVVSVFDAGKTPFSSGKFILKEASASTIEYYYRPGVTVNCELIFNGEEVHSSDKLYAGDYEAALDFIDPTTGEKVDSQLLSSAKFMLSVVNNGTDQKVEDKIGSITLEEGKVIVEAIAELPGNVFLTSSREYKVLPKPVELAINVEPTTAEYTPDRFGENGLPIMMRVEKKDSGEPLNREEWENTKITVQEFENIGWSISQGKEISTWEIRPLRKSGGLSDIASGTFDVSVSAEYDIEDRTAFGKGNIKFSVLEYAGNALEIEISAPKDRYDLNDMSNPEKMIVNVRYEDPQTGKFLPLTQEMWESFDAAAASESKMAWNIKRGKDVGTWELIPRFYLGDPLLTDSGSINVDVTVSGKHDIFTYQGSGSQRTDFIELSLTNMAKMLAPRILALLFIIWLVIGYIKKKRLKIGRLNPRCRYKNNESAKRVIHKDFFSVVLPYVPEKATVKCGNAIFQCNFPDLRIKATGKSSFKIINKSFPLQETKICGEFFSTMDELKKSKFFLNSFDITSVNPRTKKSLGTFSFI